MAGKAGMPAAPTSNLYIKDLPHLPIWKSVIHKTDDDQADAPTNSTGEPAGRARQGLSHLQSLSGKLD
ncbi:MAG: hypothetical protein ACXVB2_23160, partial [Isosphaeraceae bacterium]